VQARTVLGGRAADSTTLRDGALWGGWGARRRCAALRAVHHARIAVRAVNVSSRPCATPGAGERAITTRTPGSARASGHVTPTRPSPGGLSLIPSIRYLQHGR